jgi:hypothetical protein
MRRSTSTRLIWGSFETETQNQRCERKHTRTTNLYTSLPHLIQHQIVSSLGDISKFIQ